LTKTAAPILILAGTSEATELARELSAAGRGVVMSFAGRTTLGNPPAPPIQRRIGGFGGVQGLVAELRQRGYPLLVDATHPFATRMAQNAVAAARLAGVPRLRLLRPPWRPLPGACWYEVDDLDQAAKQLEGLGARRAFLSIGSNHLGAFASIDNVELVLRSIQPPAPGPEPMTVILERGPFTVDAETALLRDQRIDVVVARNSGGPATEAKLTAAHRLSIPVIMVRRPEQPAGARVSTVHEALLWIEATLAQA
jgi:precorrin-6A/cobalt-precorrin-6A reductase